jgi:hypothetical protein
VPIFEGSVFLRRKRCRTILDPSVVAKTDLSDNSDQSFAPGASRRHASRGLSRLDAVTHLEGTAGFFTVSMSRATDNPVTAGCRRPEQKSEIPG